MWILGLKGLNVVRTQFIPMRILQGEKGGMDNSLLNQELKNKFSLNSQSIKLLL